MIFVALKVWSFISSFAPGSPYPPIQLCWKLIRLYFIYCYQVVDLVRRAVPIALMPDDDPLRDELKQLQTRKEEIDLLAHKQVRRILWTGLALSVFQVGLFFRLTFWEFSWDVMEPIAFFTTTTSIVLGYAYFLFTSRDPTYQDLMKRLFLRRQRKLLKKYSFDVDRFVELQKKCKSPLDAGTSIKNRVGVDLDLEDALRWKVFVFSRGLALKVDVLLFFGY